MAEKTLVLFDFDGTLTKGDSLRRFLWFAVPPGEYVQVLIRLTTLLFFWLVSGKWTRHTAKEAILSACFKGKSKEFLFETGRRFCRQMLPTLWRSNIYNLMLDYKKTGARVMVISASIDIWLSPMAELEGVEWIGTELTFESGVFTGRFNTPNCRGAEKVVRLHKTLNINDFDKIIAYGNSAGDQDMLALAHEAHWI